MQKHLLLSFFIFLFSISIHSQEKDSNATVSILIGKAYLKSKSTKNVWGLIALNDKIRNGDELMTGNGSMVTLTYKDSEIKLTQNSSLTINTLYTNEKDGDVEVKQGIAWFKLANLGNKKFTSNTRTTSAGVRGTSFATLYDRKTKGDLTCVCEGKVEVTGTSQGSKPTLVEKGNGFSLILAEIGIISYKGEISKGISYPKFADKIEMFPILKNCLSCHTPKGWEAKGFLKDEQYAK